MQAFEVTVDNTRLAAYKEILCLSAQGYMETGPRSLDKVTTVDLRAFNLVLYTLGLRDRVTVHDSAGQRSQDIRRGD